MLKKFILLSYLICLCFAQNTTIPGQRISIRTADGTIIRGVIIDEPIEEENPRTSVFGWIFYFFDIACMVLACILALLGLIEILFYAGLVLVFIGLVAFMLMHMDRR